MIWKLILGGLWKPIALLLGAFGLYAKATSDANARRNKKDLERRLEAKETREEVEDEVGAKNDAAVRAELDRWVRPE